MSTADTDDRIERWIDIDAEPDAVWAAIGAFDAIGDWHPGVTSCELIDIEGDLHRRLTLADGGALFERLIEQGPRRYVYEIVDGPLPVSDYRSVFSVTPRNGGSRVFWTCVFEAEDETADGIVAGVYEAGLEVIRDRFAG